MSRTRQSAKKAGSSFERLVADYLRDHVDDRIDRRPKTGEAEIERGNDDALVGVVVHKRHGRAAAGEQFVTMRLADFAALLSGERPDMGGD